MHTKGEWETDGVAIDGSVAAIYANNFQIAAAYLPRSNKKAEMLANAARIVQAVNAFEEMRCALEDARGVLRLMDRSRAWVEERDRSVARIEAALARAGGGTT